MDRTQAFRSLIGRFTTGVAVIGVLDGKDVHGATVNSFTSLSLDPMMVLFCLRNKSLTYDLIKSSGVFSVSILNADQQLVSNHFAGKKSEETVHHLESDEKHAWVKGANAVFKCTFSDSFPGGDHTIITGEVIEEIGPELSVPPLVYHEGKYSALQSRV